MIGRAFILAIDGPSASGKSTIAKNLAFKYNFTYVDSGAMYRAIAMESTHQRVGGDKLPEFARKASFEFVLLKHQDAVKVNVKMNGKDVSDLIRSNSIAGEASRIAKIPQLRQALTEKQRHFAQTAERGLVMDGRDVGTEVFPSADLKIFLIASARVRAERRAIELGGDVDVDALERNLVERDNDDMNRKYSPLRKAPDAIVIDSSSLAIDDIIDKISRLIEDEF